MRFAVDTGGTFTDLVVESDDGGLRMYKAPTTPSDPVAGVLETLSHAADDLGESREALLGRGEMLIHGTTHAINAIVTGNTARTAFLTTKGHPDVLVFREGGRIEPFNFTVPYPEPYVPRSLTYEVPERVAYDGTVTEPLDEAGVVAIIEELKGQEIEAVGVCLLWSIVNPAHELRVGELLERHLPGVPYTLSHVLNPSLREYRRASSTCIDGSLKPLMGSYLGGLESRLRDAGFGGRVLVVTTQGGAMDAADMASAPIHSINSGPAMAPIAGPRLRPGRFRCRYCHHRRHRRHHLRREPGTRRPHPVDKGDLDRSALPRPHDRLPGGGREEHRRGRRQHRLGRRGRPAPRRAEERRCRPRPGLLRRRRHRADRDRRIGGPRLDRPRLLPRRHHGTGDGSGREAP